MFGVSEDVVIVHEMVRPLHPLFSLAVVLENDGHTVGEPEQLEQLDVEAKADLLVPAKGIISVVFNPLNVKV